MRMYKDYIIEKTDLEDYRITTPYGNTWRDQATSLEMAERWIDCAINERKNTLEGIAE